MEKRIYRIVGDGGGIGQRYPPHVYHRAYSRRGVIRNGLATSRQRLYVCCGCTAAVARQKTVCRVTEYNRNVIPLCPSRPSIASSCRSSPRPRRHHTNTPSNHFPFVLLHFLSIVCFPLLRTHTRIIICIYYLPPPPLPSSRPPQCSLRQCFVYTSIRL